VASDRQVAANRRNARSSSGPRSASGKKRASKNAFRHGLTKPYSSAEFDREVETLARQIAGDTEDRIIFAFARDAVEAVLELARVRRAKIALIERATALGRFDVSKVFQSPKDEFAGIMLHFYGLPEMPSQEPERAEVLRRILCSQNGPKLLTIESRQPHFR